MMTQTLVMRLQDGAKAYSDLEGTILCKDGDTVAYLTNPFSDPLIQSATYSRPVFKNGWVYFDGADDYLSNP